MQTAVRDQIVFVHSTGRWMAMSTKSMSIADKEVHSVADANKRDFVTMGYLSPIDLGL